MAYKELFSRFLTADPTRLHFAAHSHHLWPDVAYDAHCQAWLDAAQLVDRKWDKVFSEVVPQTQAHITRILGLDDPAAIAFAPNTHELVARLVSCFDGPVRILSTDAEFHSFSRQSRRWEEAGVARVERIPVEPFDSFHDRFVEASSTGEFDLVFVSQVFFNSGFVFDRFAELADAVVDEKCFIVIDGYHGFMALPTDLSAVQSRLFYLAGGYKYAMAGEGACFMHCPPGYGERPLNTGWFAGFGQLEGGQGGVHYATDGSRFLGSTFDPSAFYRFNAVQTLLADAGITPSTIHAHVRGLQRRFIDGFEPGSLALIPSDNAADRGHFLTFRTRDAGRIVDSLAKENVIVDRRDDRLRFGFGLYHDDADVDLLLARLAHVAV